MYRNVYENVTVRDQLIAVFTRYDTSHDLVLHETNHDFCIAV